jgi:spermidine synthase
VKGVAVALAAIGFTSTIAQLVLMREMVATFYGNELLFGLVLMAWLAWVAVGSWGLARLPVLRRGGTRTFAAGVALAGVLLAVQIVLVRGARLWLGVTRGALVEFGPMVVTVVLVLCPLCLLVGCLFTCGARLMVERGGTAGQAYVWESVGAVVGGALFGFFFIRYLDPFQTASLVVVLDVMIAIHLLRLPISILQFPTRSLRPANCFLPLASCFLALVALPVGHALDDATLRWQWPNLVFAADSPYGRLTIEESAGQRSFFQNGLLAFETQGTFPEQVVHLPLLAHPNPRRILLIGGGVAGDVREILKQPVASITYVELDPLLIEAAQAFLPPEDSATLADPRVTLILADGRQYVRQCVEVKHCTFDVVLLDLPEPATGTVNRFYTREFFAQVRTLLSPGGILALGLPSAENYWSLALVRRNSSIYHTLQAIFPNLLVLPGEHDFFLASDSAVESDPAVLAARLTERGIETRQVTPAYIKYVLTTDRFARGRQELEANRNVRLNSDLRPICYYYDLALWLSRFYPNLRGVFESASLASPSAGSGQILWWIVVPLALVILLARWQRKWAVPIAIACIGLSQMTLEVVTLFGFQVTYGYVYAEVSLIVTAFMAGLALGGVVGLRTLAPARSTDVTDFEWRNRNLQSAIQNQKWAKRTLVILQASVVVCSGVLLLILLAPSHLPAAIFLLFALLAGCLTGMAFPLAVAVNLASVEEDAGPVVGRLYGADLVGGCLGAASSAVFLVPVLGIPQTCSVVALVGLVGLLALIS